MIWIFLTLLLLSGGLTLFNPTQLIYWLADGTWMICCVIARIVPQKLAGYMVTLALIASLITVWQARALTHGPTYHKRFWLPLVILIGLINLLIAPSYMASRTLWGSILSWFGIVWLTLLLLMATYFSLTSYGLRHQATKSRLIIVLGAQVTVRGLSRTLKRRLDCVVAVYNTETVPPHIIVSGGQGRDEPQSEARAMAAYLIQQGVLADHIQLEDHATSTQENFRFSRSLLPSTVPSRTAFATSDYHVTRSKLLAHNSGFKTIGVLAAPTSAVSLFSATLRELVALTYYYRYHLAAIWGAAGALIALNLVYPISF